jgi:hypothetical protein
MIAAEVGQSQACLRADCCFNLIGWHLGLSARGIAIASPNPE